MTTGPGVCGTVPAATAHEGSRGLDRNRSRVPGPAEKVKGAEREPIGAKRGCPHPGFGSLTQNRRAS